jgi:hypothetical protein
MWNCGFIAHRSTLRSVEASKRVHCVITFAHPVCYHANDEQSKGRPKLRIEGQGKEVACGMRYIPPSLLYLVNFAQSHIPQEFWARFYLFSFFLKKKKARHKQFHGIPCSEMLNMAGEAGSQQEMLTCPRDYSVDRYLRYTSRARPPHTCCPPP